MLTPYGDERSFEAMSQRNCPGEGRKWGSVWHRAVCPVCGQSSSTILRIKPDAFSIKKLRGKIVPTHELRKP